MIPSPKCLLFLLLSFIFLIQKCISINLPPEFSIPNCEKDLPYFSVGDIYLGDQNYTSILQNKSILLIASLQSCLSCCNQESQFASLRNSIQADPSLSHISIGRIELTTNRGFQEKFKQIKRFPFVIFFPQESNQKVNSYHEEGENQQSQQQYHIIYQDLFDRTRILRFLHRSLQPIQQFSTFNALNTYINAPEFDEENIPIESVKVIGLFYDTREMKQEIAHFKAVARSLLNRSELHFCLLTRAREVKAAKAEYSSRWFDGVSLNTIVIQRGISVYEIIDISEIIVDLKNLKQEIIHKSLRLVDEFTMENYAVYTAPSASESIPSLRTQQSLKSTTTTTPNTKSQRISTSATAASTTSKPILIAVVDSILDVPTTKRLLALLESLAKQFVHSLHITWVEGNLNPEKKKMLGIAARAQLPQLAFFRIDDNQSKIVFPDSLEKSHGNLLEFIEDYFTLPIAEMNTKYQNNSKKLLERLITNNLSQFQQLHDPSEFKSLMQIANPNKDTQTFKQNLNLNAPVLWYYIDLEEKNVNESTIVSVNLVAQRVRELFGTKSNSRSSVVNQHVQFTYSVKSELLESTDQRIIAELSRIKANTLYLIFNSKRIEFKGSAISTNLILKFLAKHTKNSIPKLPSFPEIKEEDLLSFFVQQYSSVTQQ